MLDADLAALYGVETKMLVRTVKRNAERFPEDFMFQLTAEELVNLRCQFGTPSSWGGRRYPPYAFTEQGVAMLSSVLRSRRAAQVNVEIMRGKTGENRDTSPFSERCQDARASRARQFKLQNADIKLQNGGPDGARRAGHFRLSIVDWPRP